ncbi:FAD:protein FMN transferase [Candidatus Woesearchaeota archaeon]|nr:FAD:protein FMN transferase [Candidatus Woesearchaeota archaeon]
MKKALLCLLILFIACTPRLYEVKETRELMGTFVTITVHHPSKDAGNKAISAAFDEILRIENLLSNYKNTSEVSILNKNKIIENPSEDLIKNIRKSFFYGELSDGHFDITVQPMLDLYKESFQLKNRPPTAKEIEETLEKISYKEIKIENRKIAVGNSQKITLGGIAKGYAVDRAVEILKKHNIKNALVNAGGDMRAIGRKYGSAGWSVALANPRNKDEYIEIIPISDKAIVTSGDYERFFNKNKSFHHIINPNTGYSASELISVTIIANNAFDADALSTSVFVLGKEKGLELIENLNNTEGLIITKEREIIKSTGFSLKSGRENFQFYLRNT